MKFDNDMKYKVKEVIERLQQLIVENPKIADATFGIYTLPEDYDDVCATAYDIDIEPDGYYDAYGQGGSQFTIGEHDDNPPSDDLDEDE